MGKRRAPRPKSGTAAERRAKPERVVSSTGDTQQPSDTSEPAQAGRHARERSEGGEAQEQTQADTSGQDTGKAPAVSVGKDTTPDAFEPLTPTQRPAGLGVWTETQPGTPDSTTPDTHPPTACDTIPHTLEGDAAQPAASAPPPPGVSLTREGQADATRRWRNEGISEQVAAYRDRIRTEYIDEHPGCKRRDAHEYAWGMALAEFPPPSVTVQPPVEPPAADPQPVEIHQEPAAGLAGLADLPATWPVLPPNASLQAEVSWVQANRLRIVQGDTVDLTQALSPAPSYAALGWLETSILFPAKFADVSVKATMSLESDKESVRREKASVAAVAELLASLA